MTALRFEMPLPSFVDSAGMPISGGTLEFYIPDTSTPKAVYLNKNLVDSPVSVVTLDAAGRMPEVYVDSNETYKIIAKDADGAVVRTIPYFTNLSSNNYTINSSSYVTTIPYTGITITDLNYSHFPVTAGFGNSIETLYTDRTVHGQTQPEGACLLQTLSSGGVQSLTMNGQLAVAGVMTLGQGLEDGTGATKIRITPTGDDTGITFTVYGRYKGVNISETVNGANIAAVLPALPYALTTLIFDVVTGVTASGDTDGDVSVGPWMTAGNISLYRSTAGFDTPGTKIVVGNGGDSGKYMDYGPAFGITSDGVRIAIWTRFNIEEFSNGTELVGKLVRSISTDGINYSAPEEINVSYPTAPTAAPIFYGKIQERPDGSLYVMVYFSQYNWEFQCEAGNNGVSWTAKEIVVAAGSPGETYSEAGCVYGNNQDGLVVVRTDDNPPSSFTVYKTTNKGDTYTQLGYIDSIQATGGNVSPTLDIVNFAGNRVVILAYMSRASASYPANVEESDTIVFRYGIWSEVFNSVSAWSEAHVILPAGSLPDRSGYPSLYINPLTLQCLCFYGEEAGTGITESSLKCVKVDLSGRLPSSLNASKLTGFIPINIGGGYPYQMNYGGFGFDGTTTRLYGFNPSTTITNTKFMSLVCKIRFATASAASEYIVTNASTYLQFYRVASGQLVLTLKNAAGTVIASISTASSICSEAGTYIIWLAIDMTDVDNCILWVKRTDNGSSERSYSLAKSTFTNDTIGWNASTNWALGGSTAGALKFNGDMYCFWFTETTAIDFNIEANRRKFFDVSGSMDFIGCQGEKPLSNIVPVFFFGYGTYKNWVVNRGSAISSFTEVGAMAVSTAAAGKDDDILSRNPIAFTPFIYGASTAGSPTYTAQTGYYSLHNNRCIVTVYIALNTSLGGMVGDLRIGGLPFKISSTSASIDGAFCNEASGLTGVTNISVQCGAADTTYLALKNDQNSNLTNTEITVNFLAKFTVNFIIA